MQESPWFESWFNSPYYHLLYKERDGAEARAFIERLTNHLNLPPKARILDLACGKGRHSISLADLGYEVMGIDIAPQSIESASGWTRPGLSFAVHDMREPLNAEPFDSVMNLFTSFGYFDEAAEHRSALHTMAGALKKNGKLVIDYLNVDEAIGRLVPEEEQMIEGIRFQVERKIQDNHLIKEIRVTDPGQDQSILFSEKVAMFRLSDFDRMLQEVGLTITETLGDYLLRPFEPMLSPRLILICEKI